MAKNNHDFDSIITPNTLTDLTVFLGDEGTDYFFGVNTIKNGYLMEGNYEISDDKKTVLFRRNVETDTVGINLFANLFGPVQHTIDSPNCTIVELYGKKLHISNKGIDIYLKKQ